MTAEELRDLIEEHKFDTLWPGVLPDYQTFLIALSQLLGSSLPEDTASHTLSLKLRAANRIRIDGTCQHSSGPLAYWVELVWLPKFQSFRGNAHARALLEPPPAISIDEFVAALRDISEDQDLILSAQAYYAVMTLESGLKNTPLPEPALRASFDVFERFPDEDFDSLVHLVHTSGQNLEVLVIESLQKQPSAGAVSLLSCLLASQAGSSNLERSLHELRSVEGSALSSPYVRELANHMLTTYAGR